MIPKRRKGGMKEQADLCVYNRVAARDLTVVISGDGYGKPAISTHQRRV